MDKRESFIGLCKPGIGDEEAKSVAEVLKSGWLTTGPKVKEFEESVNTFTNTNFAVGLTSATGGLHIVLAALGIGPGDEVIIPTYTFISCAHIVNWLGATPILVDVEPDTFNIDVEKTKAAITEKTKAIMPVHFAGHSCDMDPMLKLAKEHNLFVIEDAAHAIGTKYKGNMIGGHGNAVVFSFYATKTITTGEGGMVVTNDAALGKKVKQLSYFGVDKDAFNRYSDKGNWFYDVTDMGYKYNMDNMHGAIGTEQMKKIDFFIEKRRTLAKKYSELLAEVPGLTLPIEKDYCFHSYHLYPLLVDNFPRQKFIEKLHSWNIGASVHFIPLHLFTYYQEKHGYKKGDFPVAESLFNREVSLPLFPDMTEEDVEYIANAIKEILQ